MQIYVYDGDIAYTKADALLTAVNSGGMWFGGIDGVINRTAGEQFHAHAAKALDADPSVKVVVAPQQHSHRGQFRDVVFTIDDLDEPLEDVVLRGLDAASAAGYRSVSMPAIRLGVMKDVGGSQTEKVRAVIAAIRKHEESSPRPLDEVMIVVYRDVNLSGEFVREFA